MKTTCALFFLAVVLAVSYSEATICPSSGFYPDASNCQGYTMCYDGPSGVTGVDLKCPNGMAFDRDGGYCSRVALRKFC